MNKLNDSLDVDFNQLARLKADLSNVEELLEERPVDTNNIIESMDQREQQME